MLRHLIADIWRPLAGLALGLVAVIAFCAVATSTPSADVQDLALFLAVSGSLSLIVGILVMYAAPSIGLGGLRARISLAHVVVIGVAFANIAMTAGLMFISSHDLGLLSLLLFFSGLCPLRLPRSLPARWHRPRRRWLRLRGRWLAGVWMFVFRPSPTTRLARWRTRSTRWRSGWPKRISGE